ncbi:hypothetical protein PPO43_01905 [Saprospira sp. CCB-QB6]|uniref:hypothetical protein n=1 Tax=Saprospira sp. CCB-QB6 TaxID=3023936 RepID=UPI002349A444|nr:hypothetical protein [Saprospira sp. CCB-QB6]WCL81851.1 hypothetical protein PPO43_01905 [Saprospira sp. CCB-QB6]
MFYAAAQKAAHYFDSAQYINCLEALIRAAGFYLFELKEGQKPTLLQLRFLGDCALMQSRLAEAPFVYLAEPNPLFTLLIDSEKVDVTALSLALVAFQQQTALLYFVYFFMEQQGEPLASSEIQFRLSQPEHIAFYCSSQHKGKEKLTENFQRLFKEKRRQALSLSEIKALPASLEKVSILEKMLVTRAKKEVALLLAQTYMDLERLEEALEGFLKAQLYGASKQQVILPCRQLAARLLRQAKTGKERKHWISFLEKIN